MNTKSQCARLLAHTKKHPVSTAIAVTHLQIAALHRRLSDLREQGHVFADTWVEQEGKPRFKAYRWIKQV